MFDRNNHKLVTGTDYTVSYSQDVRNVGVVTVTITGIGNYMGTVERAYNITPAPAVIRVNDSSKAYGEADPGFTGAVEGLFGDDLLGDIAYSRTNIDEEVGNYSDVLTATVGNLNGNYTYTVEPGNFSIVPAGGNVVTIDATGLTKTYDGSLSRLSPRPASTAPRCYTLSTVPRGRMPIPSSQMPVHIRCM